MIKRKEIEDKITIERVNDGYILTEYEEVEIVINDKVRKVYRKSKTVIEDSVKEIQDELNYDEISDESRQQITSLEAGMYRLLLTIKNKYGIHHNNHKPVNLIVEIQEEKKEVENISSESLKNIKNAVIDLVEQSLESVMYVGSANYASREQEAKQWIHQKEAVVLELIESLKE
jgi:hypothetical protein